MVDAGGSSRHRPRMTVFPWKCGLSSPLAKATAYPSRPVISPHLPGSFIKPDFCKTSHNRTPVWRPADLALLVSKVTSTVVLGNDFSRASSRTSFAPPPLRWRRTLPRRPRFPRMTAPSAAVIVTTARVICVLDESSHVDGAAVDGKRRFLHRLV